MAGASHQFGIAGFAAAKGKRAIETHLRKSIVLHGN
jgi:hypothetical protein